MFVERNSIYYSQLFVLWDFQAENFLIIIYLQRVKKKKHSREIKQKQTFIISIIKSPKINKLS